jgi:hypothetical protein
MSDDLTWMGFEMDAAVLGLRQRQPIMGRCASEKIVEHLSFGNIGDVNAQL